MKDFTNKDLIHVKDGEVEYIKFRILDKYSDKLKHCCALRHGGVSEGVYSSLSFGGKLDNDKRENKIKNLHILCDKLDIDYNTVYKATQAHTDSILILDNNNKEEYKYENRSQKEYDGYVTSQKNISTIITTADCNPIIIYDPAKNVVANVHSGWVGTVKRIYLNAVKIMNEKYDCKYEDMIVCIGPSIGKCCWVSKDKKLKQDFLKIWPYESEYIQTKEDGEFHVDFLYVIKKDLEEIGIREQNIVLSNICTRCNTDSFFSYRYATKYTNKECGRQATITMLT